MDSFGLSPALMWLLIALVLGGIEILTLSFFLLWPALAALLVSVLLWIFPDLAIGWQLVIFAVTSVVLLVPGRRWAKNSTLVRNEQIVNDRATQMIGQFGRVVSGTDGVYRVKLGDSEWSARSKAQDLKADTQVRVISVDGITLSVEEV